MLHHLHLVWLHIWGRWLRSENLCNPKFLSHIHRTSVFERRTEPYDSEELQAKKCYADPVVDEIHIFGFRLGGSEQIQMADTSPVQVRYYGMHKFRGQKYPGHGAVYTKY